MNVHKDSAIHKKYSAALMSNHKWRKLFETMAESAPGLSGIEYRFTDTDRVLIGEAPAYQQVWETAVDTLAVGPIEYKHIESISIPRVYQYRKYDGAPTSERSQQVGIFLEALTRIGQFPIFEESDYVVIKGYEAT